MKIANYRYIESLNLPPHWIEKEVNDVVDIQAVRSFSPVDDPSVKIELFYRGFSISEEDSKSFREILKLAPKIVFDRQIRNEPLTGDAQIITALIEVLGNVGNNQLTNNQQGFRGPAFILERLEIIKWLGKPLLTAKGAFQEPESGKRINEFYGFFIDTNPNTSLCNVEEIYLETPIAQLHKQYLPVFRQCLNSIRWLSI